MYLDALPLQVKPVPQLRGLRGTTSFYRSARDTSQLPSGAVILGCQSAWDRSAGSDPSLEYCTAYIPDAPAAQAAAPQITVTVPTTTQVSPQISPQFIQQEHPVDSGITAGTAQGTAPAQDQTTQALIDLLAKEQAQAQQPPQVVTYAAPVPQQATETPAALAPQQATMMDYITKYSPALIAVAAILTVYLSTRKGKHHVS